MGFEVKDELEKVLGRQKVLFTGTDEKSITAILGIGGTGGLLSVMPEIRRVR